MTDTFRSIFSLTAAGRAGRGAFFAGTILFFLLSALLSYFAEDGLSFEHYVAWVTTEDIQVTFVASLEEYAALAMLQTLYRGTQPSPFAAAEGVVSLDLDRAAYENDHALLLADPASPPATTVRELFRACAAPDKVCTRFSSPPNIENTRRV